MKTLLCALLASVMVFLCPMTSAFADSSVGTSPASPADESAAAAVFSAMHDDIERCFSHTNGNAFVMVEALVDDRGRARRVEATGDARAGLATRTCVERRVARALFPVPRGGGTSRVRTSFVFARE